MRRLWLKLGCRLIRLGGWHCRIWLLRLHGWSGGLLRLRLLLVGLGRRLHARLINRRGLLHRRHTGRRRAALRHRRLGRRIILRRRQYLRRRSRHFFLEFLQLLGHYIFIVREVRFQPAQCTSLIIAVYKTFELIQLLIGHLLGQAHADVHLQTLVYHLQQAILLVYRQSA